MNGLASPADSHPPYSGAQRIIPDVINHDTIGWAMFDEATDRLMNATPQTIQVERELAHHVR